MIIIILVINLGSSSLRFNLFSKNSLSSIFKGICENIGTPNSRVSYISETNKKCIDLNLKNHKEAFSFIKKLLIHSPHAPIKDLNQISAIGHRVVHGGSFFDSPSIIDSDTINKIKSLIPLAPIHNAINLEGILDCQVEFPNITQVAVFDTSFFFNLPEKVKTYPIPYELSKKLNIRKYGFHGISHKWALEQYMKISSKSDAKVISCHLGSGSSICAIENGTPIDISMGLTPLGGLMMSTRSGSMDPSVVTRLVKSGINPDEIDDILNKKSGLLGISEFSGDIRELLNKNDYKSNLALDMFIYKIIKYIGSYIASLKGIDSIIFTGGIGENNYYIREKICNNFKFLGIEIDKSKNEKPLTGTSKIISNAKSSADICVVRTNEEYSIAEQTRKIIDYIR